MEGMAKRHPHVERCASRSRRRRAAEWQPRLWRASPHRSGYCPIECGAAPTPRPELRPQEPLAAADDAAVESTPENVAGDDQHRPYDEEAVDLVDPVFIEHQSSRACGSLPPCGREAAACGDRGCLQAASRAGRRARRQPVSTRSVCGSSGFGWAGSVVGIGAPVRMAIETCSKDAGRRCRA